MLSVSVLTSLKRSLNSSAVLTLVPNVLARSTACLLALINVLINPAIRVIGPNALAIDLPNTLIPAPRPVRNCSELFAPSPSPLTAFFAAVSASLKGPDSFLNPGILLAKSLNAPKY